MPETVPVASFDNPRFSGKKGPGYNPNTRSLVIDNAVAAAVIDNTLETPGDGPVGHSQQNDKGIEPTRQQNILTDRVPLDAAIIDGKRNQEIQQTSASTTRS